MEQLLQQLRLDLEKMRLEHLEVLERRQRKGTMCYEDPEREKRYVRLSNIEPVLLELQNPSKHPKFEPDFFVWLEENEDVPPLGKHAWYHELKNSIAAGTPDAWRFWALQYVIETEARKKEKKIWKE